MGGFDAFFCRLLDVSCVDSMVFDEFDSVKPSSKSQSQDKFVDVPGIELLRKTDDTPSHTGATEKSAIGLQ